ncbi:MAG: hypothetical protein ISR58_04715 [Anaerolineales bacterium]|nr:hypothetical protein [Chloroflexota bacterium]MBL6980473.1 hypothetical protein [Anaerolineales bacterium]
MTPEEKKEWKPEKFPQPRTFPAEWDMSGLMETNEENAEKDDDHGWKPEKFPQPRAFPENWHSDDRH